MPDEDLDLRLVRYFTAVADHLHFGRAAAALHVAQPSLSRQIHRLEQLVGARLLDRDPQGTRLTEAGADFLPRARALLRDAAGATASARAVARPDRLVVGFGDGLVVTAAVARVRAAHPGAEVRAQHLDWPEPSPALAERRVDAVVARMPFVTAGLDVDVLVEEPRVLVVPRDHRLAGKDSVSLDDIAGEPMPRYLDPAWDAFWRVDPRPDGRRAPDGPLVAHHEDKAERIAAGEAVSLAPAGSVAALRPDLAAVPVDDVEPCRIVLATRAADANPLLVTFAAALRELFGPSR